MKKRRLIKDFTPLQPPRIGSSLRFASVPWKWTEGQKQWLATWYGECENWRLALTLNCDEMEVVRVARRMGLKKTPDFLQWERRDPNERDHTCPAGFHWETEEERAIRLEQERRQDMARAADIANTFDFCDLEEKKQVAQALIESLRWARDTQPETDKRWVWED